MTDPFKKFHNAMDQFAVERDWEKFHSPKNLVMALSVEVAELQECFQWLTESQSKELNNHQLACVREEIADVQLYLIRLAGQLGIDIESACWAKLEKNSKKYPVDKVKGSAAKYTQYRSDD